MSVQKSHFGGNVPYNHVGLLITKCFRGKAHGPNRVHRCRPFLWRHRSSPDKHKAPAGSISVFLPIVLKLGLLFPVGRKLQDLHPTQQFSFHCGSWLERVMTTGRDSKAGEGKGVLVARVQVTHPFQGFKSMSQSSVFSLITPAKQQHSFFFLIF